MPLLLADAIFWTSVILCIVAEVAIVRSALVVRPATESGPSLPPVRRGIEVVWSVVPALALIVILALTWRAIHRPAGAELPASPTVNGVEL